MILVCTFLVSLGAGAALMGAAKFLRPAEVRQCAGRTARGRGVAKNHHVNLFVSCSEKVVPQRGNKLPVEGAELLRHDLGVQNTEGCLVWHVHGGNVVPGGLTQFGGQ